jgi:hypothetical protein
MKQHEEAVKLLQIIFEAAVARKHLTYITAAQALGRPKTHTKAVGAVCDLLDAAAALADVPLFALVMVRGSQGAHDINPKAWGEDLKGKEKIIQRSKQHIFTKKDVDDISKALDELQRLPVDLNQDGFRRAG